MIQIATNKKSKKNPLDPNGNKDLDPRAKNTPNGKLNNLPPGTHKEILGKILPVIRDPEITSFDAKGATPQEIAQRILWYFDYCELHDMRPGVEGMCFSLGIDRSTFNLWVNRRRSGREIQDIAIRAKQALAMYFEQVFVSGKVNPATGIFLLKNWFGYQDVVVTEHREEKPQFGEDLSNEEIINMIE